MFRRACPWSWGRCRLNNHTANPWGVWGSKKSGACCLAPLARIMHEPPAAIADLTVLPGVLGSRTLRRTEQVRLRSSPAVPRDGCPVARPSARSRYGVSSIMRARCLNLVGGERFELSITFGNTGIRGHVAKETQCKGKTQLGIFGEEPNKLWVARFFGPWDYENIVGEVFSVALEEFSGTHIDIGRCASSRPPCIGYFGNDAEPLP